MIKSELRSLFFYTPLIAAMAGNVGVQSSAIIVQGIANQVIKGSLINRLFKEIGLGLIKISFSKCTESFGETIPVQQIMSPGINFLNKSLTSPPSLNAIILLNSEFEITSK